MTAEKFSYILEDKVRKTNIKCLSAAGKNNWCDERHCISGRLFSYRFIILFLVLLGSVGWMPSSGEVTQFVSAL